jgi:serine/threonine protein kinase
VKNIKITDIQIEECLGSGHFGSVHKASWNGIPVAVKMLLDNQSAIDKIKFLQEAAVMGQFNHTNVIKLHGVVNDSKCTMLVVELMKGDLHHYLCEARNNESAKTSLLSNLLGFCRQICLGMIYLSNRGYIHRDLAARNILLTESRQCKV